MKFTPEVIAALQTLKDAAENDFERMYIEKLEHSLFELVGQRFGKLTVIKRAENTKDGKARWFCECDCGNNTIVSATHLKSGKTQSCGCLHAEAMLKTFTKHGLSKTKSYRAWSNIKTRCSNPNGSEYENYGGRGITICEEWRNDFQKFYDYVSQLPHFNKKGYSLDRIDNNGNYEPGNVRWADKKTQARNKSNNTLVNYNGVVMTLAETSEKSGISLNILSARIKRGDTGDKLFRPVQNHSKR